jgi:anthranilate synthase
LFDSNPEDEEAETELKASAMLSAIRDAKAGQCRFGNPRDREGGRGHLKILLVDHEDSFVHTLANYFRQTGAKVTTVRSPVADEVFDDLQAGSGRAVAGTGHARRTSTASRDDQARRGPASCRSSASASACRR